MENRWNDRIVIEFFSRAIEKWDLVPAGTHISGCANQHP